MPLQLPRKYILQCIKGHNSAGMCVLQDTVTTQRIQNPDQDAKEAETSTSQQGNKARKEAGL